MKWIKQNSLYLIGGFIGSVAGYFYWLNTYCNSEACAINSTPFPLMINFGILGGLLLNIVKPLFYKHKTKTNGEN